LILLLLGITAAIALIVPATAAAEGEPDISLTKTAPETALIGTSQPITLLAKNPAGPKRGYNLTFRDVLDPGVEYKGGSPIAPRIIENAPTAGKTTLIFENVADLSVGSEYALTFNVEASSTLFAVKSKNTYKDVADAYVSRKPRVKPTFGPLGEVDPETFKGTAHAEAETRLTAVEIEKEQPEPENEILRGVHEHQVVYTLHLRNNKVGPTEELAVDDYLPAGLEFLGCGQVDNTTATKTNALGANPAEEYPGSGSLEKRTPEPANCIEPTEVTTEEIDPPGKQPPGVYTHVRWTGLGELGPAPGENEKVIEYVVGIPILRNALFPAGEEPSPKGLGQIANLDNNTGAETFDEEELTNTAEVEGEYEEVGVSDRDEQTVTAEDLAVQKTVNNPKIADGQVSVWSLEIESSEYRYVNDTSIADLLPNGLCPLGEKNYEGPEAGVIEPLTECEPDGSLPSLEVVGKPATLEHPEYTEVEEQPDGTFKINWDKTTAPLLGHMNPSERLLLKFPTKTRVYYQSEYKNAKPVLTGDSWTNTVGIAGDDFARCAPGEPNCEGPTPAKIFHEETDGTPDTDVSAASQEAGGVTIKKTVRENEGMVPENCDGNYVEGKVAPLPLYGPGDKVCWTLRVNFASDLYAGTPVVTDFLPPDEQYVPGSAKPTANNTVASEFKGGSEEEEASPTPGTLEWTLGASVEAGEKVFEWRFATIVQKAPNYAPGEITGNLMKFVYSNTEGKTFPLRDRAEIKRHEPELKLQKGVAAVNGNPAGGNPPNTDGVTVHGGDTVTFRLDLTNSGNAAAQGTEIWDVLPEGITCGEVTNISAGGVCAKERIVWKGLAVAVGETLPELTYDVLIPEGEAPVTKYLNRAGITHYGSKTNLEESPEFVYVPEKNIDPEAESEFGPINTKPIEDTSEVVTAKAELKKTGPAEATIGQVVRYKVEATVPAGSAVFGSPTVTDPLGPQLEYIAGSATASINGTAIAKGPGSSTEFSLSETASSATVHFPATYENKGGTEDDVVLLELEARVKDVAANKRGNAIPNTATFSFQNSASEPQQALESSVSTEVIEPEILAAKGQTSAPKGTVKPGDMVAYEVSGTAASGKGFSTANEVKLVDTVPVGMKPVGALEGGVYDSGARTITWEVGPLAPGQAAVRKYTLEVESPAVAASVFTNKVTATTQSLPDVGGVPPTGTRTAESEDGTYKAKEAGYENSASTTVRLIGGSLTKEVAPTDGTIGTPLTYTLHLRLPPGIDFYNTTVEDELPNGVVFDRSISAKCVSGCVPAVTGTPLPPQTAAGVTTLGWYFGNLLHGEEREIVIVYEGHIANKYAGGALVKAKDKLANKAFALYNSKDEYEKTGPPTTIPPRGGFSESTNEAKTTTEVHEPKLAIAKTVAITPGGGAGPGTQPGDTYTYKLVVTNEGTSDAWDAEVEDDNPQVGLRNVVPVIGAGSFVPRPAGEPLLWKVHGPIEAGESIELTYSAELDPTSELSQGEKILNTADVPLSYGIPVEDQKPGVEYREYTEDPEDSALLEVELPQLKVEKTTGAAGLPDEAPAEIGKPFRWRVFVTNESATATTKEVKIVDTLPKGWEFIAGSSEFTPAVGEPAPVVTEAAGQQVLTWANVTNLGPNGSVEVFFTAKPTTALIEAPGVYINTAVATGKDAGGSSGPPGHPYESSDTAKANLTVPGLEIEKTPDGGSGVAGSPNAYQIKITNGGAAEATGLEVVDTFGTGNEYTAGTATAAAEGGGAVPGFAESVAEVAGKKVVTWKFNSLAAGASVTIKVPVKFPATLADGTTVENQATVNSDQQPTPTLPDGGSFEITRKADVGIVKTAEPEAPAKVAAGKDITYSLAVTNAGPSEATEATVSDPLPAGTKFVSAEAPCEEVAGVVECALGDLPLGFSHTYKVTVQVLSATTAAIVNEAEVSTVSEDPNPANDTSEVTTPVEPEADLAIVKTGPSVPVLLGGTFSYTLAVENLGPSDATGVTVEDALPAEVELVEGGVVTDTGTCLEAATVECELGTLVPGAKATIQVTVKAVAIPAGGVPVVNTASVASPTKDPELGNDESAAETTILPAADLAITKTAPATVEANGDITYSLHVENLGPSTAHKVVVTDPLPAGTTLVSTSPHCEAAGGGVTCVPALEGRAAGELAVGDSADFQVTVHVPFALGAQPLVNTASVKGEEGDPNTENDQSTVNTMVGPVADLSITKTMGKAEAGKPLTYTLAVTNHGPSASSAVTVKDSLPAGTTFKSAAPSQGTCSTSGQEVTCQLGALASGGSAQVSITVEVGATVTGTLRNSAKVEGPEPDPDKTNNESSVEGPVTPAAPSAPNLKVVKTADTSSPTVGTPFHYDVAVSNMGGAEAKNVKIVDTLNGPVKVLSIEAESGKCEATGSKISCTIPSIPVGKTVHITYSVVAEAVGPLSNTASAQASNGEIAPSNNHAVKSVRAKAAKSPKAHFTLTKTASQKVVDGGKKVGFTITLRNGPAALVNATVCDRLPAALVFVKAAGASFVKGEACWQRKFVAAHKVLKLHLTARAVRGVDPRKARNVASASAENVPKPQRATATVRIKPAFAGAPGGVTG
jgi:fimbrial isopeptide formation D2 family protein/uncharacterized repeat protein (TIGR01451 family)